MATRHLDPPVRAGRSTRSATGRRDAGTPTAGATAKRCGASTALTALAALLVLAGAVAAGVAFGASAGPAVSVPMAGLLCVAVTTARLTQSPRAAGGFWLAAVSTSVCAATVSGLLTLDTMNAVGPTGAAAFIALLSFLLIALACMWSDGPRAHQSAPAATLDVPDAAGSQIDALLDMFEPARTGRRRAARAPQDIS